MPKPALPMEGSCRCGATRIRITAPPLMTAACHCRGCQKMAASAYSLTAMIPTQGFEVSAGEPVVGGAGSAELSHMCCPDCMTWMFTRITGLDMFLNVRPTMLDDPSWFTPFIETMTAEKLPWAQTPARHSFEGFPPMEAFEALMAEFAAEA
ncbi:GFA family protein [Ponticoccus gilvus]|nr:GFA family protein [Enemella evansiae]